jgi:hypothetical protein
MKEAQEREERDARAESKEKGARREQRAREECEARAKSKEKRERREQRAKRRKEKQRREDRRALWSSHEVSSTDLVA